MGIYSFVENIFREGRENKGNEGERAAGDGSPGDEVVGVGSWLAVGCEGKERERRCDIGCGERERAPLCDLISTVGFKG